MSNEATPSITAEEFRQHKSQGTLSELADDREKAAQRGLSPKASEWAESRSGDPEAQRPGPSAKQQDAGLVAVERVVATRTKTFDVNPVGKPRQTRSDKWKERPCVMRYRDFCDQVVYEAEGWDIPKSDLRIVFYVEAPKTKQERAGDPHHLKPDVDNLLKAFFDALEDEDKYIYDVWASAYWCKMGNGHIDVYTLDRERLS